MSSVVESVSYGQGRVFYDTGAGTFEVGHLTGVDVEFSIETAGYKGGKDVTLVRVVKEKKVTAKAQAGKFNGALLAKALGATTATGKTNHYSETFAHTTGTITVANAATYVETLQVLDAAGKPMTKVESAPAVGQYSVAAGVYTLNAAEPDGNIVVDYRATTASGKTHTVSAGNQSAAPTFRVVLSKPDLAGNPAGMEFFACVMNKLSAAGKAENFSEYGIDIECQADAQGRLVAFTE